MKLEQLETRRAELTSKVAEQLLPSLQPKIADSYRERITSLCVGLEQDSDREAARQAIRGLIEG